MRFLILLLFSLGSLSLSAIPFNFCPPLDIPESLSANFGELRPNHFHSGIDIKTEQREGLPVFAVADGYVSRISISPWGYGNCLYITHPKEGLVSVYAHLQRFDSVLDSIAKAAQYDKNSFSIDLNLSSKEFPVTCGQQIALSGNTGSSGGPHLHFELRDQRSEEAIEPQTYFPATDNVRPRFRGYAIRPVPGKGIASNRTSFTSFSVQQISAGKYAGKVHTAWGKIGLEFKAFDYMANQGNFYGVKSLEVWVDSVSTFKYEVNRINFQENKYINAFIDYERYMQNKDIYMCAYVLPNNKLPMFNSVESGYLMIDEERDYKVKAIIKDFEGNQSELSFTLRGKKTSIPVMSNEAGLWVNCNQAHYITYDSVVVTLPKGALYEDLYFRHNAEYDTIRNKTIFSIHHNTVPLHKAGTVSLPIASDTLADKSKYYVAYQDRRGQWGYAGGEYHPRYMYAPLAHFGNYTILVDTIPPTITLRRKTASSISFKLKDADSGVASYTGWIDGKWVVFVQDKYGNITYYYDPKRLSRGNHHLKVEVVDHCGNKQNYMTHIKF